MGNELRRAGIGLQGLAAGIQGKGGEFSASREKQRQTRELMRQKTVFTDSARALNFAEGGRWDLVTQLGINRMENASQFPEADFTETQDLLTMSQLAEGGNQEAQNNLLKTLQNNVKLGEAIGVLTPPKTQKTMLSEEGDQLITVSDDGTSAVATDIPGLKKAIGEGIDFGDFRQVNLDVGKLVVESGKVRNAAQRLDALAESGTATDQLAGIFTFMKALDPRSVVREGEQEAARATGGLTDQFLGMIAAARGEGGLRPEVFAKMVETAKLLSDQTVLGVTDDVKGYLGAFGDRLNDTQRTNLRGRIPALFNPQAQLGAGQQGSTVDFPTVTTQEQYDALPVGTVYRFNNKVQKKTANKAPGVP